MTRIHLAILLLLTPIFSSAQKNIFFADIGMSSSGNIPGISVTYNRKVINHLGLGVGIQGYEFTTSDHSFKITRKFIPAIFADVRAYIPVKRSLLLILGDLGMNIYRSAGSSYELAHRNGIYSGVGIGYHYRITKAGLGPYVSLKMANDIYSAKQENPNTHQTSRLLAMNADLVLSVGVKF